MKPNRRKRKARTHEGLIASLCGVCCAVVTALLLAWVGAGLHPASAHFSLAIGFLVALILFVRPPIQPGKPSPPGLWGWITITIFTLFSLRAFLWLVFADGDDLKVLSPNNLGDISLHLTFIRNFANGVPFWPANPIFAGQKLHYPIGVDLFNSLLVLSGMDVFRSLIWVGLAGAALTAIALYRWGGSFTLAGFLFNGGFAGLFGFIESIRQEPPGLAPFFAATHFADFQAELAWKSIPLSMLVTQRGLLYALPAGLALLWLWRARLFQRPQTPVPLGWRAVELLLYSTMPLFHVHTFLFLSLLLGYWLVAAGDAVRIEVAKLIGCALIPASILMLSVSGLSGSASNLSWEPGWMGGEYVKKELAIQFPHLVSPESESPEAVPMNSAPANLIQSVNRWTLAIASLKLWIQFWFLNFGFMIPAVAGLLFILLQRGRRASLEACFVFPACLIFLLACFVMFSHWDWDNTKLMIWCYLALLPFIWQELAALGPVLFRSFCCFALFASGFVSLIGGIDGSHTGYEFAKRSELDGVQRAVRSLPPNAVFACFPTYNHPLLLDGRDVVMGYPGHLSSYGIDYESQNDSLTSLMGGGDGWREEARVLGVRYLFWGPLEEAAPEYANSTQPWRTECKRIGSGPWGEIYDLLQPAPPAQ